MPETDGPALDDGHRDDDAPAGPPLLSLREQAQLIAEERARQARRQALVGAAAALIVVVLAVVGVVGFAGNDDESATGGSEAGGSEAAATSSAARADETAEQAPATATADEAAVIKAATSVPASVLDRVGRGQTGNPPQRVANVPALTEGGKPVVLYVGAEYCPFCASQRWAVIVALSRFGTFQNLRTSHSASDDVYPDTQTVSFHGATYTSDYLVFQGVETATNVRRGDGYAPLDTLTPQQQQIVQILNAPPYVSEDSAGAIPFMDFGNRYILVGGSYDVRLLQGKSAGQIAAALTDPKNPIAQGVHGTANMFTALICELTGGKPARVCDSPATKAYEKAL